MIGKRFFYCESCGWKSPDSSDIVSISTSSIPLGIIKMKEEQKYKEQPKKTKCPNCGKLVTSKRNKI